MRVFGAISLVAALICIGLLFGLALVVWPDELVRLPDAIRAALSDDEARLLAGSTALSAFVAILFGFRSSNNALAGAGLVLAAVLAYAALWTPTPAPAPTTRTELEKRLEAARKGALELGEIDDELPIEREVAGGNSGLAAAYFTLKRETRLRFDLTGVDDEQIDTLLVLERIEGRDIVAIASNDDSPEGPSSRLEQTLEPGRYLLDMRNIRQLRGGAEPKFRLTINSASLEDVAPRERTVVLPDGAASRSGQTAAFRFESAFSPGTRVGVRYRIDVNRQSGGPICLVLDVDPFDIDPETSAPRPPVERDTILILMKASLEAININDDVGPDDLGSRIAYKVEEASETQTFVAEVRSYGENTPFTLQVELIRAGEDGNCDAVGYARAVF